MAPDRIDRARGFMLGNARLLERRLFEFRYDGGDPEAVLAALAAYQNPDGGFGAGLEPDKRDPASQPVDVQIAFETMDAAGDFDGALVLPACEWLMEVSLGKGGVPNALASLNAYPHAPWWRVAEDAPGADLNPTAAIVGLLLKHRVDHPWVERASAFCWAGIEASDSTGFHELMPSLTFLEHAADRVRAAPLMERLVERIGGPGVVALEVDAPGYVKKPLDWAPRPASPCRRLFSGVVIADHLAALAARQQEDGGWPINWDPISPGVGLECRGMATLAALATLQAYGA
jgi:hypothetical protein